MMRRAILLLLLFVVLLVAPTAVRYFQYYDLSGAAERTVPVYDPATIPTVPTPEASSFVDEPEMGDGVVLIDMAHNNQVTLEEMTFLDGRLAARGFELVPFAGGDLATVLRPANAFIVATPIISYTADELLAVANFVDRGGRLLLIGDPSRFNVNFVEDPIFGFTFELETNKLPLNSLANEFGIVFNGDYLYNTLENEGNFRNIILEAKGESFAENVDKLAFYGSHSLEVGASGTPLLTGDDNTWSSATDRPGGLVLAATSHEGRVLALGDIHFFLPPYHTVFDNSQFIAQVADFLTDTTERGLVLGDFPYFYQTAVNLVYTGQPDLGAGSFDEIIALQNAFERVGQTLTLADEASRTNDTLYLGLYNQASDLADILADAGITLTIDPPILLEEESEETEEETETEEATEEAPEDETEDESEEVAGEEAEEIEEIRLIESALGNIEMSGTALVLLDESGGQRNVVVLAASTQGLESMVYRLIDLIPLNADYALSDCLLQGNLALCPTHIPQEAVEAELGAVPDGPPAPPLPPVDPGGPGGGGVPDLGAVEQGPIIIGETVTAVLAEAEAHAWIFSGGPAVINVTLESGEDLDGVIELYGPTGTLLASSDSGVTGLPEELLGIDIPDGGRYTIRVSDFFNDGGEYTLSVEVGELSPTIEVNNIFVFGDDDSTPMTTGFTSVSEIAALLDDKYSVTTWLSSQDGPLSADNFAGIDLLVWDSGDYRDENGFSDDVGVVFDYLDQGGSMLIIGASPALFGQGELSPLLDLEVSSSDPFLTNGLAPGTIISLDQAYDTIVSEFLEEGGTGTDVAFLLRGPNSERAGEVMGIADIDQATQQRNAVMLFPFTALPEDIQPLLLENIMAWFTGGFG